MGLNRRKYVSSVMINLLGHWGRFGSCNIILPSPERPPQR